MGTWIGLLVAFRFIGQNDRWHPNHTDTFKSLQDAGNCGAMPLIVMAIRRYFEKCGLGEIRTFSPSSRQTSLIDISKKQKTE